MKEIKVHVTQHGKRKFLMMYYDDPNTGKRLWKSSGQTSQRAAEREAGKWENEIRAGRYRHGAGVSWDVFRERYEREVLASLSPKTFTMVQTVFAAIERICKPAKLASLTAERLSYFQSQLRDGTRSEATIRSYLAHIRSALKWAHEMGLLVGEAPKVKMPKRAKGSKIMKGRPITTEEFERMLGKIEAGLMAYRAARTKKKEDQPLAVRKRIGDKAAARYRAISEANAREHAPRFRRILIGLWLSGLRLGEAINLSWDDDAQNTVDLDGKRPMFRFLAEREKGGKDRLIAMTPDFAKFLAQTPKAQRTGLVFPMRADGKPASLEWVSAVISDVGKAAGVKVDTDPTTGGVKYASAHDLRRSFGARWAPKVMPTVLQELMRHESIETTLKYYVGRDAQATADVLWSVAGVVDTFVDTCPETQETETAQKSQPSEP